MVVVLELLAILAILSIVIYVAYRVLNGPQRKVESKDRVALSNHQEMFLLVQSLVWTHQRGYNVVFLDPEEYNKAQALCASYKKEVTP